MKLNSTHSELVEYYHKRASEYDKVYCKPERQKDLEEVKKILQDTCADRKILEIGCGTGYWTQVIATKCKSLLAIDINTSVLDIAKRRDYLNNNVDLEIADMHNLPTSWGKFDLVFGGFVFSHIPRQNLKAFLRTCSTYLEPGGQLLFMDNLYVAGSSTPLCKTDSFGNTYQKRRLASGEEFEILKNFPTQEEMKIHQGKQFLHSTWKEWQYYWISIFA